MRRLTHLLALAAPPLAVATVLALAVVRDASSAPPSADAFADASGSDVKILEKHPFDAPKGEVILPSMPKDAGSFDARLDVLGPKIDAAYMHDVPKPIQPDPTPLVTESIFVVTVHFDKGNVTIPKSKAQKLAVKAATPRYFGRFAIELYVGPALIDRIRFDFPLISDDSPIGDTYGKGLDVSVDVKVPDSDRPTRMEIWDRATDRRWVFPYPPKT